MTADSAAEWVDAEVSEIRRTPADDPAERKYIMILTERGGERVLPIWIGPTEATALALSLESAEMPRPFTYKLAASMVAAAGSGITEVRITKLVPPIFYACVLVASQDGQKEVDARPSDAVNMALVSGAPIRIDASVFGAAGSRRTTRNCRTTLPPRPRSRPRHSERCANNSRRTLIGDLRVRGKNGHIS